MLNELCALTGWTRRGARPAGSDPSPDGSEIAGETTEAPGVRGRGVGPIAFGVGHLERAGGQAIGPLHERAVEALKRHGELAVSEDVEQKLLTISASTIDRCLAPDRQRLRMKGRQGTKPGSLLKRHIPIRTFAEWDDRRSGFCEADLVAHDGGWGAGEFCQTLDLVCIATGWTEMRALKTKAQRWVLEALADIRRCLPFDLLGLDCDNGGEFINFELFRYCEKESITFTRSRPYRKNDNCFVEQKNWPVIRQQVGYARYDTPEELEALRQLYLALRLYVNFFQPQMKLISKTRKGSKVAKTFDLAMTPYQRVLASVHVDECTKQALQKTYLKLNPAQLKRDLVGWQDRLIELANTKPETRKEVKPSPDHPFHDHYSWSHRSRTSLVRQPR